MGACLYLVRHASAASQVPDAPLTADGVQQAHSLASRLRDLAPDAAYSSPFRRALETIRPYCEGAGLGVTVREGLRERHLKDFDRHDPADEILGHLRASFADRSFRLEGGESQDDIVARAMPVLVEVAAAGHARPIVATHGNLLAALFGTVDPAFGFDEWRAIRNPHLFRVEMDRERIRRFEDLG